MRKALTFSLATRITLATASGALVGIVFPASATIVQVEPAQYFSTVRIGVGTDTYGPPNSSAPEDLSFSVAGSTVSTTNHYNIPSLEANAHIVQIPNVSIIGGVESTLDYYFKIVGPTASVDVPVKAFGEAMSSDLVNSNPQAGIRIIGPSVDIDLIACPVCGFGTSQFFLNDTFSFATDQTYVVQMFAFLFPEFGIARAFVDPFFDVPAGYSIELSEGIGNSPLAVSQLPEPSTLSLIGLGLLGLGAMRRRRRYS